jgi:Uma2 family endonuclease
MSMAVVIDPSHRHWTAADLCEIPDDRNRYEIIDGELFVTPSPSMGHQGIAAELFVRLHAYLREQRLGNVYFAPADVHLSDDTVVEPDLFVVPLVEGRRPRSTEEVGRLLLVIEILSRSTARADRTVKRQKYQSEGVPEYWIVDGDARVVERWRPEDDRPEIISELLDWRPDSEHPALTIELPALFAVALGD